MPFKPTHCNYDAMPGVRRKAHINPSDAANPAVFTRHGRQFRRPLS